MGTRSLKSRELESNVDTCEEVTKLCHIIVNKKNEPKIEIKEPKEEIIFHFKKLSA